MGSASSLWFVTGHEIPHQQEGRIPIHTILWFFPHKGGLAFLCMISFSYDLIMETLISVLGVLVFLCKNVPYGKKDLFLPKDYLKSFQRL